MKFAVRTKSRMGNFLFSAASFALISWIIIYALVKFVQLMGGSELLFSTFEHINNKFRK